MSTILPAGYDTPPARPYRSGPAWWIRLRSTVALVVVGYGAVAVRVRGQFPGTQVVVLTTYAQDADILARCARAYPNRLADPSSGE